MTTALKSYKELKVWQLGMQIARECYEVTKEFPRSETFGMVSQIRRAAASIPANVAEGHGRGHTPEYIQFMRIAHGSLMELETHLQLSADVGLETSESVVELLVLCDEQGKMISSLIWVLQAKRHCIGVRG